MNINVVTIALVLLSGGLSFGAKLVGVEGLAPNISSMGDSSNDPLVNEKKMREILSDAKAEAGKKIKFIQLYSYKRYKISEAQIPFLLDAMKEPALTVPVLQLFYWSGWRFEVDELVPSCQPYVDACLSKKEWNGLDELRDWLRRITPIDPLPHFGWIFDGQDPKYGIFENSVWARSDEYLAHSIKLDDRKLTNCDRKVLAARYSIFWDNIKIDGSGITEAVVAFCADDEKGFYARGFIGKSEVPLFMALIDNKNQQVSMLTRKILQKILHVNEKTNFRQWWMEHEATFSFDDYLINIITDKSRSTEDRVACIFHIRVQALSGNDKIGEASLCKISSILLDSSEPEGLRLSAYACLSDMVKDHSATHPTDLSWKNVLIKPAVSLFDKEVFYRTIRFMTPAEAITGDLRDKFKAAALDDKLPPARRASAINVLGRGCAVYKEHRVEDAKLALSVLDDYSRSDKEIESFLHPKSRGAQAAIKTTHAQIVCLALESMTGRKDCGYDIEKWRKAVAELAAKAGRPEQR